MRGLCYFIGFSLLLSSCAIFRSGESRMALKIKQAIEGSPVFSKSFTGFTLLDPVTGKTLADVHGDHYFIPASNTKILTLAVCLEVLGDSVPGMQVIQAENKFIFRGTGDPTFLHPKFQQWQSCRDTFLAHAGDSICHLPRRFPTERFGPGWAWDDYNEAYQPERSEMPIYGNCLTFRTNGLDSMVIQPPFFQKNFYLNTAGYRHGTLRLESDNLFVFEPNKRVEHQSIPFRRSVFDQLLGDTIRRQVEDIYYTEHPYHRIYPTKTLFSTPIDTVLRRMMHQSDNFIAEQMLLVGAGVKFDFLQQDTLIRWMLDSVLTTLPQRPKWVDGSGLSRYNLMTPQSITQVLQRLWKTQPQERLFSLFPAGGVSGTINDWYAGKDGKPFVFAKTGGMSGVQCLSGYLLCKSGKVLIFSFMHNNFVGPSRPWKAEMQRILEMLQNNF